MIYQRHIPPRELFSAQLETLIRPLSKTAYGRYLEWVVERATPAP